MTSLPSGWTASFNRELYILQQDGDQTLLVLVLLCKNQAFHLYLEPYSKMRQHENRTDLIKQHNFHHKFPSSIKSIFPLPIETTKMM
jgi:hypothetical protein